MGIETALQSALYTRLNAASLGVVGVYDTAQQAGDSGDATAFPYVTMGRIVMSDGDTKPEIGHMAQIRIHTFSRTGSTRECKTIQGKIYTALHRDEMIIAGYNNYSLLREDSDCFPDQDGKIHGVCEYRALIESA